MANEPQDKMTDSQYEEQLGLDASQKSALEAAGLSKAEIRRVNAKRILGAIAKQRERLDMIEDKYKEYIPDMQTAASKPNERTEDESQKLYEIYKGELEGWGEKKPWDGMDNLIYTNEDYWKECSKVLTPQQKEIPADIDDMSDEELEQYNKKWQMEFSQSTEDIFERRRMGCIKARYEWIKGGCKGPEPEGVGSLF